MKDQELEQQYTEQAMEYIQTHSSDPIPEGYEAVFMAGVIYGLNLREQELE